VKSKTVCESGTDILQSKTHNFWFTWT